MTKNPFALQTAQLLRTTYFGGNWTAVNLRELLSDLSRNEAYFHVPQLNSIALLTFHIQYYHAPILGVLQGKPLDSSDKESFNMPELPDDAAWEAFKEQIWLEAETLAKAIETLSDKSLGDNFSDEKYGNYYRNLHGLIEHTHYHMGQIALIKKILRENIEIGRRHNGL